MSLNTNALRLLLRGELFKVDEVDRDRVAYENRTYDPPAPEARELWLREQLLVASERRTSSNNVESLGQYRVDVFTPEGMGTQDAEQLSQDIAEQLRAGTSLTDGDTTCHVYRTERLSGRADPGPNPLWYQLPVVVYWRAFTATS